MKNPISDLELAKTAALKAGEIMLHYQQDLSKLEISSKGRFDLLTQADVACENAIISCLKDARPEDGFLGEESGGDIQKSGRTWIIDPIDGTTNFTHGFPFFACSIALWENGKPKTAVVHAPMLRETFTAEVGLGAFLNNTPLHVTASEEPGTVIIGTGFPYRDITVIDDYLKLMRVFMKETQGLRRPGSASYDLACVAAGRYGGFFEYALAPWDVAAGVLLITEAGGVVTDWLGGDNWLTGKRIVCGNKAIHKYLMERIEQNVHPEHRTSII
jgi:myo-inositol-1(or 4)-monophosphatase